MDGQRNFLQLNVPDGIFASEQDSDHQSFGVFFIILYVFLLKYLLINTNIFIICSMSKYM